MPGSSWGRSTERFGSTTQGYNPPSRGLSQYLQGRLQRNKKRRTLADLPLPTTSFTSGRPCFLGKPQLIWKSGMLLVARFQKSSLRKMLASKDQLPSYAFWVHLLSWKR